MRSHSFSGVLLFGPLFGATIWGDYLQSGHSLSASAGHWRPEGSKGGSLSGLLSVALFGMITGVRQTGSDGAHKEPPRLLRSLVNIATH